MRPLVKAAEIISKVVLLTAAVVFGVNLIVAILCGMYQGAVLLAILLSVVVILFVRLRARTKKARGKDEQFFPAPSPARSVQPLRYLPNVNDAGEQR